MHIMRRPIALRASESRRLRDAIIEGSEAAAWKHFKQLNNPKAKITPMLRESEIMQRTFSKPSQKILLRLGISSKATQEKILEGQIKYFNIQLLLAEARWIGKKANAKATLKHVEARVKCANQLFENKMLKLFKGDSKACERYAIAMTKELAKLIAFEKSEPLPPHAENPRI